jgi:hypothetical protein
MFNNINRGFLYYTPFVWQHFENLTIDKDDDDDSLTTVIVPYERGVILDQFVAVDNEQAVTETRLGDDIY